MQPGEELRVDDALSEITMLSATAYRRHFRDPGPALSQAHALSVPVLTFSCSDVTLGPDCMYHFAQISLYWGCYARGTLRPRLS